MILNFISADNNYNIIVTDITASLQTNVYNIFLY